MGKLEEHKIVTLSVLLLIQELIIISMTIIESKR